MVIIRRNWPRSGGILLYTVCDRCDSVFTLPEPVCEPIIVFRFVGTHFVRRVYSLSRRETKTEKIIRNIETCIKLLIKMLIKMVIKMY